MKKSAVIRLICWGLVAAIALGALIFTTVVDMGTFFHNGWSLGFISYRYDDAENYSIGNTEIYEAINEFEIHWTHGKVSIVPYDGDCIKLDEGTIESEDDRLRYKTDNGELTVQYRKSEILFGLHNDIEKNLVIYIPKAAAQGIEDITVESVSGKVELGDLNLSGELNIEQVSGSAEINNITADEINYDGVSGELKATAITANRIETDFVSGNASFKSTQTKEIKYDSVSGKLNLDGSAERVNFDSVSGDAVCELENTPTSLSANSVSGDISLSLPESGGFTVKFDSSSGDISGSFPYTSKGDTHIFGDGSASFNIDTASGDLIINTK